jgi:DNA primase
MAFPEGFVDEVRRSSDIVRYISDHVGLRKMGTSWKGLCPFHQEKSPSFNVRSEPPLFHCFGCGEGGDIFKFVMLHERASFPEAIEAVARRFGIPIPENRSEAGPDRKEREELLALVDAAAQHFTRNLWTAPGARAREYLLGRGFKKETLEKIRAGAAAESWSDLLDSLKHRFAPHLLQTAGLAIENPEKKRVYDRFRNRAVFPILNEAGRVVGFGARSLDGTEPKYLNSPESPVYTKSRVLYGLNWAKEASRQDRRLVLMEGYLDVARALEFGVAEAVATCGTALTPGHARLLRRFADKIVVNFDQDEAGQKAARKSLDILAEEGLPAHVVELPAGHDPDTFLKAEGAAAYRKALDNAPAGVDWLIKTTALEHDTRTPAGKSAYLSALMPTLLRIQSPVERAAWVPAIVEHGGLDERAAREEIRRALGGRPESPGPGAFVNRRPDVPTGTPAAGSTAPRLNPSEKLLLALLVTDAEGVGEALESLDEVDVEGLRSAPLLLAARALRFEGLPVRADTLAERVDEDQRRILSRIGIEAIPTEGVTAESCVKQLKCAPVKARLDEIQKTLARAQGENEEALLAEKLSLQRQLMGW